MIETDHPRRLILAAAATLAALVAAAPAAAAPPPNDNREDAVVLPTFPSAVHGTTAEATVERLDPQVSRCGRIESTVWYRIESAPDGTIVVTTDAAGGLAPVVRIYRRNQSNIEELDCARADPGGKAVVSLQAVRGAGYLIVVGRRPGTGDGEFDLRADLFLPPANDDRDDAAELGTPPDVVRSTTLGATASPSDGCGMGGGTVWYRIRGPQSGRVLLRLDTVEELDAIVGVFRPVRRNLATVACGRTDERGSALVGFTTMPGRTYLIAIGEQANSSPGEFRLRVQAAEAPERGAGRALPNGGVRESVNGATDVNDIWSVRLRRGTTYRIAYRSAPCAPATFRTSNRRFGLGCGSYTTFTPGRDGGGVYRFEIAAGTSPTPFRYRLQVLPAAADDIGVGIPLARNAVRRGRLAPSGIDVRDIYHFDLERLSEVRLRLSQSAGGSSSLVLLTDTGSRVAAGSPIRRRLGRGRYVLAVQGAVGGRAGRYRVTLRVRDVTTTLVRVSGAASSEITPGSSVMVSCLVSPPSSGRVELQIDRFDPLTGWHFHHVVRVPVGTAVSWRPPAPGRWRVRATYLGSARSARSRSGYAHVLVARPIR
ncbi:MAG TPA: hypothetical protein VFM13_00410 [Gaiellaceae bacterium]|nr:hypothetical protein [Gaiellaceae bacterium]